MRLRITRVDSGLAQPRCLHLPRAQQPFTSAWAVGMKRRASPFTHGCRVTRTLLGHSRSPVAWGNGQAGHFESWQPGCLVSSEGFVPPRTKIGVKFSSSFHNFRIMKQHSKAWRLQRCPEFSLLFRRLKSLLARPRNLSPHPSNYYIPRNTPARRSSNATSRIHEEVLARRRPVVQVPCQYLEGAM